MSIKKGVIEVSPLAGLFFPNVAQDDLVIRTTDTSQSVLIGTLSNQLPAITVKGSNIGINYATPASALDIRGDLHTDRNILVDGKIGINTLTPAVGLEVKTTDAVLLPKGTTAQRPAAPDTGHVRYNTTTSQFEGYGAGNAWGSLGGVKDTNNDTFVSAEQFPTSNDDVLRFVNSNVESMRITKAGYVGIGFSNPQARLHVDGDIQSSGTITACNLRVLGEYVVMNTITSNTEQMTINNDGTGPALKVTQTGTADVAAFYDDDNLAMVIADGAKVGIRSSNPQVILEINGTDAVLLPKGTTAERPAQPTAGHVRYNTTTSQFEGYGAGNAWGSLGGVKDTNNDTFVSAEEFPTSNDDTIRFINSNVESMRITKAGFVGIGFTDPQARLHVDGDIQSSGTITACNLRVLGDYVVMNTITSNTEQMTITNDGTGPALKVTQTGAVDVAAFYDDGDIALVIADGAKVGVRTSTPQVAFEVNSTDAMLLPKGTTAERPNVPVQGYMRYNTTTNQFEGYGAGNAWGTLGGVRDTNLDTFISAETFPTSNDDTLRFINSNQETMRIGADGKVSIGTSTQAERLRVEGDAFVSNGITVSNNLRVSGTTTVAGAILPHVGDTHALGASNARFGNVFVGASNMVDLGGVRIRQNPTTRTGVMIQNSNNELSELTVRTLQLSNWGLATLHTSNGFVGMNTSNPQYTLHVNGSGYFQSNLTIQGDFMIQRDYDAGLARFYTNYNQFQIPNGIGLVLEELDDYVGVVFRQAASNFGNYAVIRSYNGSMEFLNYTSNGNTTYTTALTSTGRLGVGTSAPSERFQVTGNVKVDSNLFVASNVGIGTSNPGYTLDVRGAVFAQTYCNLLVNSFSNTSTSNAPSASALKSVYDTLMATSNNVAATPSVAFSSNTSVAASNTAYWTSNNALIRSQGGTIDSNLQVQGTLTASNLRAANHVLPTSNLAYDLGSESNRFRDIYLAGSKIDLNGLQLRKTAGGLAVLGADATPTGVMASQVTLSNQGSITVYTSNNFLGINNSNPTVTVDITGDAGVSGELRAQGINTGKIETPGLFVLKNSNITHRTTLAAAIQNILVTHQGVNLYVTNATSNDALRVLASNAQREPFTVNALGFVGMSAPYPRTRLTISPSNYEPKLTFYETTSLSNSFQIGISSNQFNFHIPDSNATFVFQYANSNGAGTDVLRVQGNGTLGIYSRNSNQPVNLDFIRGSNSIGRDLAGDFRIQASSNGHLVFQRIASNENFSGEILRMNHMGYVGVSNPSPLTNLDVSGTFGMNRSYFRKDFTFVGASNDWTTKKYLGEIASGTTIYVHITGYGDAGYVPFQATLQKQWGSANSPKLLQITRNGEGTTNRVRFYWYTGSTNSDTYYHLWFEYFDLTNIDTVYATLDVYGLDPTGGLAWKTTAEPAVSHIPLAPPSLCIDAQNNYVGIGTSNPQVPLQVQGAAAFGLFGYHVPRTVVSSLSPNLWAVAGEANTRVGNYAPTLGGTILNEVIQGKAAWKVAAQDSYVEFPYTIGSTVTTFTVALALASPPFALHSNGGILFNQIVNDTDVGQNTNHSIAIASDYRSIVVDETSPSGGAYSSTILPPTGMAPQSVLVVRRNTASSLSLWYNGVKLEDTSSFTEVYNGTAPTKIRLGARSLNATNYSPVGLAFAAVAVWDTALSDAHVRTLTFDALTAL